MADDTLRVGFVGIGDQGGPIAHMIHRAGFPTTVWARRPEATKPFAAEGIATVASLRELGANCDFIGVCVTDDTACEQVILEQGMLDDIADGTIIAIHSTIHPDSSRRIAEQAEPRGARVLDAPVSGTSSDLATVASLRELGANCDFIGVCVTDDTACEQVILEQGMLDDIADGTIIAIHSTIHPDSSRRIAEQAEPRGARVLDAPVSGTS